MLELHDQTYKCIELEISDDNVPTGLWGEKTINSPQAKQVAYEIDYKRMKIT